MTRRSLTWSLVLALAGCQLVPVPHPGASSAPHAAKKADPPQFLQPLPGATQHLAGEVLVDAGYAVAHGQGQLLTQDGAGVVGVGILGHDGGTLVDANGQVVAAGGGNVIATGDEGTSLVAKDGSTLIGSDGAGLLTSDGGGLITSDGAGLITSDGAGAAPKPYHLAATSTGASLPAAGMRVSVVDPATGLAVPLGKDAAGKDVFSVYTDAHGRYAVDVPAKLSRNMRVVARAAVRDPRLALNVITAGQAGSSARIDEPAAIATAYIRYAFAEQLLYTLRHSGDELVTYFQNHGIELQGQAGDDVHSTGVGVPGGSGAGLAGVLAVGGFLQLQKAMLEAGGANLPPDRQLALALVGADRLIANMDLDAVQASFYFSPPVEPADKVAAYIGKDNARDVLAHVMQDITKAAAAQAGTRDEDACAAFFAAKPYVAAANVLRPPSTRYRIAKPADLGEFLVHTYFTANDSVRLLVVNHVLIDLGLPLLEGDALAAAGFNLYKEMAVRLYTGTEKVDGADVPVLDQVTAAVREAGPKLAQIPPTAGAAPPPVPVPTPPAADPPLVVTTEAGTRVKGDADGPALQAQFLDPACLVFDPKADPQILYVMERARARIRRVHLDASGHATTVDTLSGAHSGMNGGVDKVAPADATYALLGEGVFGPDGLLYVADTGNHCLCRLDLAKGYEDTVAGLRGTSGDVDGPLASATFNQPVGLAFDPQGRLWVGENAGSRLRMVDFAAGTVTTVLGDGTSRERDDDHARLGLSQQPRFLHFLHDGRLLFASWANAKLHAISSPPGPASAVRFFAAGGSKLGPIDGYYCNARLDNPEQFAEDRNGRLLLADSSAYRIRAISPEGWVTTVAGTGPLRSGGAKDLGGWQDGRALQARFDNPGGVAVAKDGTIWVGDAGNQCLRAIRPVAAR